jgi:tryptophan 2,3-dioxygenase
VRRRQQDRPTLKEAVYSWLYRTPIHGSSPHLPDDREVVLDFIEEFLACHERNLREVMRTSLPAQALAEGDEERLGDRYAAEMRSARAYLLAEDAPDDEQRRHLQRLRAAILFIDSNRQLPLLSWPSEIIDSLIEVEQAMLVFRQRHARMVERVIGRRVGTGGSEGVDYLDRTALHYRVFKEIWAARTLLLHPALAPAVKNADFYALRAGEENLKQRL